MRSHQNQFGSKSSQMPSSKMSPALAKAMGGSNAKNLPKKPIQSSYKRPPVQVEEPNMMVDEYPAAQEEPRHEIAQESGMID